MTDCRYFRNILIVGLYSIFITLELVCTSFLIDNTESIKNILKNETFQEKCNLDRINTFDNGVLYENTFAFLIMLSVMVGMILINILYYNKKSNIIPYNKKSNIIPYNIEEEEEESKPLLNIIKLERIELTFNIILIMSIIGVFALNVTQFIFQLYNVSISCIELIDDNLDGFLVVYSLLECCCTLVIISVFFMYAFFK